MDNNIVNIIPHASSLIESMRSIGYSFETAIADIIDNSISAEADLIKIYLRESNNVPYIQIMDNGWGMEEDELVEAMRLGSKNPVHIREKNDLGRFGLGLKSASFSQCRVLTVVSKRNEKITAYQWDLDLIYKTNEFSVRKLSSQEINKINNINEILDLKTATIVQWEVFDRITDSSNDLSDELADLMNKSIEHISLIFHRFISEGLKITVNNEVVAPKDPFLENHSATQELKDKSVVVEGETIYLQPYVIPHYSKLSIRDKGKAGKANEQYKSQGFYLYRNKRLIVWGDYLGLSRKTELGKNVRIKVDIPNSLDYLWEIDVKKSRANVPSKIKKNLLSAITDGESVSKKVNTYRGKIEIKKDKPLWDFIIERNEDFFIKLNEENELYKQFFDTLTSDQKRLFGLFANSLAANIPFQAIYSQVSGGKEYNNAEDENLVCLLEEMYEEVKGKSIIDEKLWLKSLLSEEPYGSNTKVIKFINERIGE